ncbi:MAG: PepSY domain-containing protein [Gammaproteobacteria bacterium]|nr:hypothetical protein [Gammaproteobacteria bacterium]
MSIHPRKLLILSHRWLGIPMSVLFVLWFASGIVMIHTGGMPELTESERITRADPLDLDAVRVSPIEAAEQAFVGDTYPGPVTLLTVLGRPAYRFGRGPWSVTVFADTGELLEPLSPDELRKLAARYAGVSDERVHHVATLESPDQWTLTRPRDLPLEKFRVDDASRTEIYASPTLGEVVLATTQRDRWLAWAGAIPHWFYVTPLRVNQPAWYWTVVVASAVGCVLAVLGLVLAVTQFRPTKPFRLSASIRYRGLMRWHYILGALFGALTLTWAFSGMLSMEPFGWTRAEGFTFPSDALSGGPLELGHYEISAARFARVLDRRVPKEIELLRIQDEPYYRLRYTAAPSEGGEQAQPTSAYRGEAPAALVRAADMAELRRPFEAEPILARLRKALPTDIDIVAATRLDAYDAYYYARDGEAPLPVLRVELDDPLETWVYVDLESSRIVAHVHRWRRLERWLFNGLHSLDFAFWYDRRPLWDIGMILLNLGGLVMSAIGLVLGARRIGRIVTKRTAASRLQAGAPLRQ